MEYTYIYKIYNLTGKLVLITLDWKVAVDFNLNHNRDGTYKIIRGIATNTEITLYGNSINKSNSFIF